MRLLIETPRLALRPFELSDARRIAYLAGDYQVAKMCGRVPSPYSVAHAEEWIAGHAPAATHLPLSDLSERWREIPTDRTIVVVCRSGYRSAQATGALVGQDLAARNLAGGMQAWELASLPIIDASGHPGSII